MVASDARSTSESLSGQVSGTRSFRRYLSSRLPIFKHNPTTFSTTTSETGSFSHIIIAALSYEDSTTVPPLNGTKHDFCLMLKRCNYLHDDTSGRITLLNDFAVTFKDAAGVEKIIPAADTRPKAI
ncbi:hypothetical protein FRC01_011959, partial [Tulasnella sp. 417]